MNNLSIFRVLLSTCFVITLTTGLVEGKKSSVVPLQSQASVTSSNLGSASIPQGTPSASDLNDTAADVTVNGSSKVEQQTSSTITVPRVSNGAVVASVAPHSQGSTQSVTALNSTGLPSTNATKTSIGTNVTSPTIANGTLEGNQTSHNTGNDAAKTTVSENGTVIVTVSKAPNATNISSARTSDKSVTTSSLVAESTRLSAHVTSEEAAKKTTAAVSASRGPAKVDKTTKLSTHGASKTAVRTTATEAPAKAPTEGASSKPPIVQSELPNNRNNTRIAVGVSLVAVLLFVISGVLYWRWRKSRRSPFWSVSTRDDHDTLNLTTMMETEYQNVDASLMTDDVSFATGTARLRPGNDRNSYQALA